MKETRKQKQENLYKKLEAYEKENQRLNNNIKILLKENEAKEKVIIKQDNVLNKLEKWLEKKQKFYGINQQGFSWGITRDCLNYLKELEESDKIIKETDEIELQETVKKIKKYQYNDDYDIEVAVNFIRKGKW